MNKHRRQHSPMTVGKPAGGYRTITTQQICAVWSAYHSAELSAFLDVRVYWALHELAERRTRCTEARRSSLDRTRMVTDILRLVRVTSAERIRASLRRLEAGGLVQLTDSDISFGDSRKVNTDAQEANDMLQQIDRRIEVRERSIAVPRRMLRFLARNGRPALCATVLAHLIRCLWRKGDRFIATGCCSIAFVADLFGLHERNVKRARAELWRLRWLRALSSKMRCVNTHGAWAMVNLAWRESEKEVEFPSVRHGNTESPPPTAVCDTKTPPPIYKHNLPSGSKNHNPASGGPVGVRKRTGNPGKPVWHRVVPDDLRSAVRLDALFAEAVAQKLVRESAVERLRFFAAAEHAIRIGKQNPCGLFVAIVRRGLWSFSSQEDEDRALQILKRFDGVKEYAKRRVPSRGMSVEFGAGMGCRENARRDFVIDLVRKLAAMRSIDSVGRRARNGPTRNDVILAAA